MNMQELQHIEKCMSKIMFDNFKDYYKRLEIKNYDKTKDAFYHFVLAMGEIKLVLQMEEKKDETKTTR